MISKNCCKKILKSTGLKVEKEVISKFMDHLSKYSNELSQNIKDVTMLRRRKTIQLKDLDFVLRKFEGRLKDV